MRTKGFTLIELAVVLAIIAVLAAVLTPLVTGYLDQARVSRAQADLRTIADAIKLHQRDTGRYPIYNAAGYPNTVSDGTKVIFAGPGNVPTDTASWGLSTATATTTLEAWINGNFTGVSAGNTFPKAGFRGPYISIVESDPWGNQYLLNAANLNNGNFHAFLISAGPNGVLDTAKNQSVTSPLSVSSDDIVSVIQ
jgi:prepilin-type N-terminal cleavage/methylation domain-containing protein